MTKREVGGEIQTDKERETGRERERERTIGSELDTVH